MSYILEALQKSEHARQRGKVPDLSTISATTTSTRQERPPRHQPYVLAGFAVTLLAAVLGWWRPWQQTTHSQSPQLEQAAPASQQPPQEAREEQKTAASLPRVQEPEPSQVRPVEQKVERPSISSSGTRAAANRPPVASANTPSPAAATPPAPRIEKVPTKAETTAPPGRILNLQELPPAVRNSLPRLTISGYASAGDSGKRMVVVNDRLVQEGEEAGPGVTVVTVGGDGVVFDYQGYRFRPQQ